MSKIPESLFNCVFISYSRKDSDFAVEFKTTLAKNLDKEFGDSTLSVWIDKDNLKSGTAWRREIERRLNTMALMVTIVSPDSINSPWVLYEWSNSLLVQQSEPHFVHYRKCGDVNLNIFTDYQLPEPLCDGNNIDCKPYIQPENIERLTRDVVNRLRGFPEIMRCYSTLIDQKEPHENQQQAADQLGNVPEDLKLASANLLIKALQFWLSVDMYGYVGASIASALGRLGKRKALPVLTQLLLQQVNQTNIATIVANAITRLTYEESQYL